MTSKPLRRKRGQPKKTDLNLFRTKVWRRELSRRAMDTRDKWLWYQIDNYEYVKKQKEAGLQIDDETLRGGWSKWSNYRNGINVARKHAGKDSVEEAEKYYPGSGLIFRSNIWKVLDGKRISANDAKKSLMILGPAVSEISKRVLRALADSPHDNTDPRDELILQLSQIAEFDTLQAIILMLGWADAGGNTVFWNNTCALYRQMLPEFLLNEDIPFRTEFFSVLDKIAEVREFAGGIDPVYVPFFWEDEIPKFKVRMKDHYSACLKCHDAFFLLSDEIFSDEARNELADIMVDIVWTSEIYKFDGRELWRPLGEFFAKALRGKVSVAGKCDEEISTMALKEIESYLKAERKLDRSYMTPFRLSQEDQEPLVMPTIKQRSGLEVS